MKDNFFLINIYYLDSFAGTGSDLCIEPQERIKQILLIPEWDKFGLNSSLNFVSHIDSPPRLNEYFDKTATLIKTKKSGSLLKQVVFRSHRTLVF